MSIRSKLKDIFRLAFGYIKRLASKYVEDGAMILSSSVAFYFLFSIFPLMLLLISFSGLAIEQLDLKTTILDFAQERIPIIYDFVESNIDRIIANRTSIGIVGGIFALVSATYVFDSIQYSLNRIFGVERQRRYHFQKLFGLLIIIVISIILVLSFLVSTTVFYITDFILEYFELTRQVSSLLIRTITIIIGLAFNFAVFGLIYFFGVNRKLRLSNIYKGAVFAALTWEISKHIFIFYNSNFANYQLTYGSIASIISFMLWVYISSLILLLGAEINSLSLENEK